MAAIDDSMQARITADCPDPTREILLNAWSHDTSELKKLLDAPGKASVQDPASGETPLHAAIRACGPAQKDGKEDNDDAADDDDEAGDLKVEEAKETVRELFLRGAIWNDIDCNNETPGCVARRLGQNELYSLCVEAGVRAEMLFGLLDGYEQLSSGSEMDEDEAEVEAVETANGDNKAQAEAVVVEEQQHQQPTASAAPESETEEKMFVPPTDADPDVNSEAYLRSNLTYSEDKLVDDGGNGVMMAWETDIMRRSVNALLPGLPAGKRILNVGFGMGIIDTMFAETRPSRHHIIEARPKVLEHVGKPGSRFGADWEASGPEKGARKIHRGRWQEVVPKLLEQGEVYDAIYFDTFGEDYGQLNMFFMEYVPGLLDPEGRFGFFNGLGADRRICYDVYTKVVEMHTADAGLDISWDEHSVDMEGLEEAGKGEWEGVKRRYWTLDRYRLPTCTFLG